MPRKRVYVLRVEAYFRREEERKQATEIINGILDRLPGLFHVIYYAEREIEEIQEGVHS